MHKYFFFLAVLLFNINYSFAGNLNDSSTIKESEIILETATGKIYGTLTTGAADKGIPVALLIAGSGPTDRDGNNPVMKNNSLKQLAHALAENNIASVRYDKRGIAASKEAMKSEADLRFEDYINDAKAWIDLLKNKKQFSQLIVIGHSEGSLIGMIAAQKADKFVSMAGAGQSADLILKEQLGKQPQAVKDISFPIIDSLKSGHEVQNVNPMLVSLFRPSVQPYLISWFKYDPQQEIKKLKIPVLVLQGAKDIQVSVEDARRLHAAHPASQLVVIENMNHILKDVSGDVKENMASYNDPGLAIDQELVGKIVSFIWPK